MRKASLPLYPRFVGNVKIGVGDDGAAVIDHGKPHITAILPQNARVVNTKNEHFLHLDNNQIPKLKGKNVLIADDVVSTGSSLEAIESILSQVGANIIGKAFVFAEGDAAERDDIIFVESLPLL